MRWGFYKNTEQFTKAVSHLLQWLLNCLNIQEEEEEEEEVERKRGKKKKKAGWEVTWVQL